MTLPHDEPQAVTETPSLIMAAMIATLQEQLLPQLTEPSARAAAASMVQVLAQLSTTVAWAPGPLAQRLQVRLTALGTLPRDSLPALAVPPSGEVAATDAAALEQWLHRCDAYVSALVPHLHVQGTRIDGPIAPLERWLLGYCRDAAEADLRFMAPSHLGKLTRKSAPATRAGDGR